MNYKELIQNGATLIDVRSEMEFDEGHIENAINIPVNDIQARIQEVKDINSPIVLCCLSRGRAGVAKALIEAAGVKEVYNAGGWQSLL
ncbi:rhodanese-like domain-containing protein [Flammeovirga yaeyamensis]|uniref:Rhodanese-like domain-containing protein n=1 Tax=Flammeovirga yaeyamensis TaxID=367791 RepID=A0AAX1MZG4_9BACT|nr:rhodanese-like domain-containing protein [Flammeovirga yaeyamensis]MBB3700880.1 rhodanese-related sulfurtransferase [Flammeovirga yaeyamensis]NMF37988.1 rhodanese-like domain-containing protein [Flammeovirga yaeyamensis]QWG00639.1 rhodanese-like domain-containing protein [Flammeovirga yaeyamensis]